MDQIALEYEERLRMLKIEYETKIEKLLELLSQEEEEVNYICCGGGSVSTTQLPVPMVYTSTQQAAPHHFHNVKSKRNFL